jgi:hypothetical protein
MRPAELAGSSPWPVVYHIKGTPAMLVGIVDDAPDKQTAIAKAISLPRSWGGT